MTLEELSNDELLRMYQEGQKQIANLETGAQKTAEQGNLEQYSGLSETQRNRLEEIANILPKNRFDDPLNFSKTKMFQVANDFLAEENIPAKLIETDRVMYLQDDATGNLYVLGDKGKFTRGVLDWLPAAGALLGAGALAASTGGLAVAPLALATAFGSAGGAGLAQTIREDVEGDTDSVARDVAGAVVTDFAQGVGIGTILGVGLKITGVIGRTGLIQAGGEMLSDVSRPLTKAASPVIKAAKGKLTKGLATLDATIKPISKPIGEAIKKQRDGWFGKLGQDFSLFAEKAAKTPYGRALLTLGDEFKEVIETGAKAGGKNLEEIVSELKVKLNSLEGRLKEKQALAEELGVEIEKLSESFLETAGGKDLGQVAKDLKGKVDKVIDQYRNELFESYKKHAEALTKNWDVTNPTAYKNVSEYSEQMNSVLTRKMSELQEEAARIDKALGDKFTVFKTNINRQLEDDIAKVDSNLTEQLDNLKVEKANAIAESKGAAELDKIQNRINETQAKLNAEETRFTAKFESEDVAQESLQLLKEDAEARAVEATRLAKESFQEAKADVDIGQQIQNRFLDKYQADLVAERELYNQATELAKTETNFYDASRIFEDINLSEEIGINPESYSRATAGQLLNLKKKLDSLMQGANKDDFAKLAKIRGRLVSDENNIFSQTGSPALTTYQKASAARIQRNDDFQRREFLKTLGNIDYKTGNIVRNKNRAKDVFNETEKLIQADPDVAERTLKYAFGEETPTILEEMKLAKVKNIFNKNGGDVKASLEEMKQLMDEAGRSDKEFYKQAYDFKNEIKLFEAAENIKNVNITQPTNEIKSALKQNIKEIDSRYKQELLKEKERTLNKQAETKVLAEKEKAQIGADITAKQREAARQAEISKTQLKRESENVLTKQGQELEVERTGLLQPISEKEQELINIKGQLALDKFEKNFQEKNPVEYQAFKRFAGLEGLSIADQIPDLARNQPEFLKTLFDRAGVTADERKDIFNATFLPNMGKITREARPEVSGMTADQLMGSIIGKGQGKKEKSVLSAFTTQGNESYFQKVQDDLITLKNTEEQLALAQRDIGGLEKDISKTSDTLKTNQAQLAAELDEKRRAQLAGGSTVGAGLGAAASLLSPDFGVGLGALAGGIVGAGPGGYYARKIADYGTRGAVGLVNAMAGQTVPPLLRQAGQQTVNQLSNPNQGILQPTQEDVINQALKGRLMLKGGVEQNVDQQGSPITRKFLNGLR